MLDMVMTVEQDDRYFDLMKSGRKNSIESKTLGF